MLIDKLEPTSALPSLPRPKSLILRFISFVAIGLFATSAGFVMTTASAIPSVNELISPPTDAETLDMYVPPDDFSAEINEIMKNNPIAQELRKMPDFIETRPYMKIPESARSHYLTGGILSGPGLIWVPPLTFLEEGGKSMVTFYYLGNDISGHPGIVHGGLQATLLDEGLARCSFGALPNHVSVTANLTINYKAPMPTNSHIVSRAELTKVEGRKAWVTGRLESMPKEGEKPIVYVEATGLFIEPKQAATMARLYPAATSTT